MSDKILKLSQAQTLYQDLRERINALPTQNDIPSVPVQDVQVNGVSILNNGIANVPLSEGITPGVIYVGSNGNTGLSITNGQVSILAASTALIKSGQNAGNRPIRPGEQHYAVFYGLAKAAGADMASSNNAIGTYTDTAKAAIQNMLGITDLISTEESSTATAAHALNSTFMMNGKLHRATAAIAIGDAVELGTNCEVVKADEVFVKNTDYASYYNAGVIKTDTTYGTAINNGYLRLYEAEIVDIKGGTKSYRPITPNRQHVSIFYGLSKVAGVDLANETVALGTYPETSKTAIRSLIGAGEPLDVQINGTSIVSSGIADIPLATSSDAGVIKPGQTMQVYASGAIDFRAVGASEVKAGTTYLRALTPERQHASVFYGLAKAAGADMASSDNAIGTYTETAKVAIRNMLGAASSNVIAVQDEQPTDTDTKVWLPETEAQGIQVPTMEDMANYVQKTDYATTSTAGLVKVGNGLGIYNGSVYFNFATTDEIKTGTNISKSGAVSQSHATAFYGLAKAAGDTTQAASNNAIGTYTNEAKSAIKTMLGIPTDIRINGESVISNNIANISIAISTDVKAGASVYKPLTPNYQHHSVFYGLAKAAGDTTQAVSDNAVGTYTTEAKSAIQTMLNVPSATNAIISNSLSMQRNGTVGVFSTTLGYNNTASGYMSIAIGNGTSATGMNSYSEGSSTIANGNMMHASGTLNFVPTLYPEWVADTSYEVGDMVRYSTAGFICKTANNDSTFDMSKWRIVYHDTDTAFVIGNGYMDGNVTQRSNAFMVDWNGNMYANGNIYVNCGVDSTGGIMVPKDIQINGTSIVSNGIASIPVRTNVAGGSSELVTSEGINSALTTILSPSDSAIKAGTHPARAVNLSCQHASTFYGLAKAAGDSTQAASDNAVGTYTTTAKTAIQTMLGVENGVTFVETVSGTTPVIIGEPNVRYKCGEVSTISITPPAAGTIDVTFTSGSTPAVLTLPNTVTFPEWVDLTTLQADTKYEIMIVDGEFGGVMTWPI